MSIGLEFDEKVKFWIRGVPYVWKLREDGGDPDNWQGWERRYIFLENEIGNFLPKECPEDVRRYFSYISREQLEYERDESPDWQIFRSVVRIEGKDIDPHKVPVILLFNYKGKKLLDHIVSKVVLAQSRIPETPEREEPTILTDYHKDWYLWFAIWYIDHIMGKDKRVCFPFDPNSGRINLEVFDQPAKVVSGSPLQRIVRLCLKHKDIRYIYLPIAHVRLRYQKDRSHFMLLIVDIKKKSVYYLDPNGFRGRLKQSLLDNIMGQLGLSMEKWAINELDWCPSAGFQTLQSAENLKGGRPGDPEGFCIAWVLWVVETLINNPDKHFEDVLRQAYEQMKKETGSYTRFIRRYAKSIIDYQRNLPKKNREYIQHNLRGYVKYLEKS